VIFDEEEFENAVSIDDENLIGQMEEIKKMTSSVIKDGDLYEIKYQGIVIPIKNEKLKFNFNKINEISNKMQKETDLTKKINTFTDIYNIIDEIVKIIKKERTEENQQTDSKINLIFLLRFF
jgi:hypothetical protein